MKAPVAVAQAAAMRQLAWQARAAGKSVGLVPTMGALHEGHLSLMRRARAENGFVVASIFVNPTQFGPGEDYQEYPRQPEQDLALCGQAGVDAVFAPSVEELYPRDFGLFIDPGPVAQPLEGIARPGHFRGVATVVAKLFNIAVPDRAYFGQKDAQQVAVVRNLVRGLDFGVEVVVCPTIREPDGLAMSSRNAGLNPGERQAALCLSRALGIARELVAGGERQATKVAAAMAEEVVQEPLAELDYAAVADPSTFEDIERLDRPALALLAARIGQTRLIDNLMLEPAAPRRKK
jgi:pantoate--beta-alanine ligase